MLPWQMSLWELASVKEGPRNLHLKFGQNRVSISWNIPDMDKCLQDKYWQDKCRHYSWNLFKMVPGTYLLFLKFGQNRLRNSWDIADIEFVVVVVGGWVDETQLRLF